MPPFRIERPVFGTGSRFAAAGKGNAQVGKPEADAVALSKLTRAKNRRFLAIKRAAEVLSALPAAGEALHVVSSSGFDVADMLDHLIERLGICPTVAITTLGYNRRNLLTLLG